MQKRHLLLPLLSLFGFCLIPAIGFAQGQNFELQELKRKIEKMEADHASQHQALIDEIGNLKTGHDVPQTNKSFSGLGDSASKVYNNSGGLSIGGYGEIIFKGLQGNDPKVSGDRDTLDVTRFVPYFGYKYSDSLVLNSELEIEHGGAVGGDGEVKVESLYLDFLLTGPANFRAGHFLVPIGLVNLRHEPTLFHSVMRPDVERLIIPSTWHETGLLFFGNWYDLRFHLGAVSSLNASDYTDTSWIRKGRQGSNGKPAPAEDIAYVARFEYTGILGLETGVSIFSGDTDQDTTGIDNANVSLWEAHIEYKFYAIEFNVLYTEGRLSDADQINTVTGLAPPATIGSKVTGIYSTISFDLLHAIDPSMGLSLPFFVRYSTYNLHAAVPDTFTASDSMKKTVTTVGINFRPHPNVILKTDYQFRRNAMTNEVDNFNLGIGFIF